MDDVFGWHVRRRHALPRLGCALPNTFPPAHPSLCPSTLGINATQHSISCIPARPVSTHHASEHTHASYLLDEVQRHLAERLVAHHHLGAAVCTAMMGGSAGAGFQQTQRRWWGGAVPWALCMHTDTGAPLGPPTRNALDDFFDACFLAAAVPLELLCAADQHRALSRGRGECSRRSSA